MIAQTRASPVVRTNYNSTNMVRTIEDILGVDYLSIYDANARPMSDVFTRKPNMQSNRCTMVLGGRKRPRALTLSIPTSATLSCSIGFCGRESWEMTSHIPGP